MIFHDAPSFRIYFGNARDKLFPAEYLNMSSNQNILEIEPYKNIKKLLNLDELMFLSQVHGNQGLVISTEQAQQMQPFKTDGDFFITPDKHLGIGVMTGDCLPIIFYDTQKNVVAIVHAGWRGSVQEVAVKALESMQVTFGTNAQNVKVLFGPSAKSCCYKVGDDFSQYLEAFEYAEEVLLQLNGTQFFDLPRFNRLQLKNAGIKTDAFQLDYNICTICDDTFCSSRRQDEQRQMTVVSLK